MTQDIEITDVHGTKDALRSISLPEVESGVDRTDSVVEFGEEIVRIIERAVGKNIDLGGFQDADVL